MDSKDNKYEDIDAPMHSSPDPSMAEIEVSYVVKANEDPFEQAFGSYFRRIGSNDRSTWETAVVAVIDREAVRHPLPPSTSRTANEKQWGELFPGVTFRNEGVQTFLRIAWAACPVLVLTEKRYTYWGKGGYHDEAGENNYDIRLSAMRIEAAITEDDEARTEQVIELGDPERADESDASEGKSGA